MNIKYVGKEYFQDSLEWYSVYQLGSVDWVEARVLREIALDYNDISGKESRCHYYMTREYIKKNYPTLQSWVKECHIPFGGYIKSPFGNHGVSVPSGGHYSVNILFKPGSLEEMAFRLSHGIKVEC